MSRAQKLRLERIIAKRRYHSVPRGDCLHVPPPMTVEEWEPIAVAEQAALLARIERWQRVHYDEHGERIASTIDVHAEVMAYYDSLPAPDWSTWIRVGGR